MLLCTVLHLAVGLKGNGALSSSSFVVNVRNTTVSYAVQNFPQMSPRSTIFAEGRLQKTKPRIGNYAMEKKSNSVRNADIGMKCRPTIGWRVSVGKSAVLAAWRERVSVRGRLDSDLWTGYIV